VEMMRGRRKRFTRFFLDRPLRLCARVLTLRPPPKEQFMASPVTSSIVIGRPIEDVFAVLTNVENTEKWFPTKVREWWTSEPPHGVGSTRHAVVTVGWFPSTTLRVKP